MIERFFTPGHTIQRLIVTLDHYGGITEEWVDHLTDVEAKLWQLKGNERLSADKQTYFADSRLATAIADITEVDRYVSPGGDTYDIKAVAVRTRPDGSGHLEADLELVR